MVQNSPTQAGSNTGLPASVLVFDVFQAVALAILIVALLTAFLSHSMVRVKTWFGLIISFVFYCISFLLLAGHQTGPKPNIGLCLVQAGLIYAAPPLVAIAALIFAIELYLRLTAVLLKRKVNEVFLYWMLYTIPFVHSVDFWVAVILGLSDLNTVERHPSGNYCHINHPAPSILTSTLVIILAGFMILVEVYTAILLFRARSSIRQMNLGQKDFPLKLFFRMAMVTILGGLAIVFVVIFNLWHPTGSLLNILTVLPFSVALVFGLQTDILRVLICWRRKKAYTSSHGTVSV